MTTQIMFSNIVYDTDGEKVDLPTEFVVNDPIDYPDDELADYISDITGWCVISFNFERS